MTHRCLLGLRSGLQVGHSRAYMASCLETPLQTSERSSVVVHVRRLIFIGGCCQNAALRWLSVQYFSPVSVLCTVAIDPIYIHMKYSPHPHHIVTDSPPTWRVAWTIDSYLVLQHEHVKGSRLTSQQISIFTVIIYLRLSYIKPLTGIVSLYIST